MARLQFKVTFTNAQPGAPVEILTPSTEHVYPSATASPVGGRQLYLDASNSITVWSDAQLVIAQTLDGTGSFIQGTATVASPTITVTDGTAPTNPSGGGSAAYRPLTGMPMLVGYLGDSRMDQGGNTTTYRLGYDFMSQACLRSKGLLPYGSKQGVPGDTTTGMLTRLNGGLLTQASPAGFADCGVVVVLGGTNDWTAVAAGSITLATVKANIVAIATAIKAAGKLPVLCTETPRTAASTYQGYIDDFNTWITRYATANGLPLVDLFSVLVNPSNGQLQAALDSGDNIHPNPAGFAVMADAVIAALSKDLHGTSPLWLPARTGDTKDLLGGKGLFLTGASGLGTSWNNFSAGTAPTLSIANAADVGNWQRISRASGDTGNSLLQWSTGSGFTIGHDYLLTGRLQTSGINAAGSWVTCQVTYNGSAAEASPVFQLAADVPDGIFSIRFTIPTGVTTLKVSFQVAAAPTGACYAQVARVGLYDLTAQGF